MEPKRKIYDVVDPPTFSLGNERTVVATQLPHVVVSTVRLTIDHGFGTPLWFETMVFPHDGNDITWGALDSDRYTTEEQARIGHDVIVERWRSRPATTPVWEDE